MNKNITVRFYDRSYKLVDKDYRFDPETEVLLYADELVEGMVVLQEIGRDDVQTDDDGVLLYNSNYVLTTNRWATVTKVRAYEKGVAFVAVYDDGHQAIRKSHDLFGWYVKKDSIPETPDLNEEVAETEPGPRDLVGYAPFPQG